jgi:ABC-type nitrate/sulfonate/bicarbonate transport system ATPase subunit
MSDKAFRLDGVGKSFGSIEVLRGVTFDIAPGEFVAVVGPSGCGKTTLLNILSGRHAPSEGNMARAGNVRTVYQHDGLFPWLTVAENINLGLRKMRDRAQREAGMQELIHLIRLEGFENHYPHQLSGGMRQRVELARALAGETDILLMDEPFSALDYLTRIHMRQELARVLEAKPRTVVLVTHDIEEAAQLADRIIVLSDRPAEILQTLTLPLARLRNPAHPEVVRAMNLVFATLEIERDAGEMTI